MDNHSQPTKPTLIRIIKASQEYGLSRATLERAVNDGKLTRYKAGKATFLSIPEIEDWIRGDVVPVADR